MSDQEYDAAAKTLAPQFEYYTGKSSKKSSKTAGAAKDKDGNDLKPGDSVEFTLFVEAGPGPPYQKAEGPWRGIVTDVGGGFGGVTVVCADPDFNQRIADWNKSEGYPEGDTDLALIMEPEDLHGDGEWIRKISSKDGE